MAKNWYVGASSVAHKVKKAYVGVGNVAHKVKKAYIGDANGKARLWWTGKEYQYVLHGSDYKLRLYNIDGTLVNTCTYGFNASDAFIDYDEQQNKWLIICKDSNLSEWLGYWDGEATSITLKQVGGGILGALSYPELHTGEVYFITSGTYATRQVIKKYSISSNTFSTIVQATNNSNYEIHGFITENYSRFYSMNRYKLFYVTGTTPTDVATYSCAGNANRGVVKSGNKLAVYGASNMSQLTIAVFDVKTKILVKRTTSMSLTILTDSSNFKYFTEVGIAFDRIYFTIPSTASNKSQLAYTPMFTSDGTFSYTLLDTARFSTQSGSIVGGNNIAIGRFSRIFNDNNNHGFYRSTDGNTWTQVASPAYACFYGGTNDHVDK